MTDIEKTIKEIREFNEKPACSVLGSYLVFMCHPDTKKVINIALKEEGLIIDDKHVHFFESNYYAPGDVYLVSDDKLKKQLLKQRDINIVDYTSIDEQTFGGYSGRIWYNTSSKTTTDTWNTYYNYKIYQK